MRLSTFILISLLISQPVSAFSSTLQVTTDQAGDVTAHCETGEQATSLHSGHDESTDGTHADCETDCGSCASCAASLASFSLVPDVHPAAGHSAPPKILLPPGNTDLLYRPPINS